MQKMTWEFAVLETSSLERLKQEFSFVFIDRTLSFSNYSSMQNCYASSLLIGFDLALCS